RVCVFFFFFQAEDGIRDRTVTGVQTCALPICQSFVRALLCRRPDGTRIAGGGPGTAGSRISDHPQDCDLRGITMLRILTLMVFEIGRASCRERVWGWVGDGEVERKE